ncbi:uncharacterized protein [Watersipora subatra]|uniref:uncharacterized protein n=1 Tax=Watersipora subatra TaxID=2589382 RepID=UPI00355B7FA4
METLLKTLSLLLLHIFVPLCATEANTSRPLLCDDCSVHPDSIERNLVTCKETQTACPRLEGCWEIQRPTYTVKGCMKNVITSDIEAAPQFSDKEETYCTQFWQKGICVKKVCILCSSSGQIFANEYVLVTALLLLMNT